MASEGTKQDDLVQSPEEFIDKPKKGFMDLPPEIRDMVYKDLLKGTDWVTLIPISARSQVRTMVSRPMAENNIHTGIMYCSKTTNREATEFLYRKNTFYFSCPRGGPGDQNWRRVFAWLNKIGPANRSHLRDLRISQKSMEGFELVEDRSRVNRIVHGVSIFATQDPFRHYEELPYTLPATQGTVNSISPYVGKTLDLFGEDHWSKLKITTYTVSCLVPGVPIFPCCMPVDLPNLIE